MTIEIRKAQRTQAKLRIGLSSPSGGGKTYSALLLARGLAGGKAFGMADTEGQRGLHYRAQFPEMRRLEIRPTTAPAP